MKKSLTRKLTIAVIALVFAVVSLSTSTYAWFTMSNTAQVDAFKAEVKAGEGIEIAITEDGDASAAQWYTGNVPATVVTDVIGNMKFDAVTTNATNLVQAKFQYIEGENAEDDEWASFYIHIKTAQAGEVYLDSITLGSDAVSQWTVDKNYVKADGSDAQVNDTLTYEVANAARIAFIYKDASNNDVYKVYENDNEVGADGAEKNTLGNTNNNGALSYYNNKNSYTAENGKLKTAPTENAYVINQIGDLSTDVKLGETQGNTYITVRVLIWVEGWDAECINAIFAQKLLTSINFLYKEVNA